MIIRVKDNKTQSGVLWLQPLERIEGVGIALGGRGVIPGESLLEVEGDALARLVAEADLVLGLGVAELGRGEVIVESLLTVYVDAIAPIIGAADEVEDVDILIGDKLEELADRLTVEAVRDEMIFVDYDAVLIAMGEHIEANGTAGVGTAAIESEGTGRVGVEMVGKLVHQAKFPLGIGVALVGRELQHLDGLGPILIDSVAGGFEQSSIFQLSRGIALLGFFDESGVRI